MSEKEKNELAQAKPAKAEKPAKTEKKSKPGLIQRISKWFKELRSELKKVQWPSWKSVLKNTGVVIACVLVVGICIWLFDALANGVVGALLSLVGKA